MTRARMKRYSIRRTVTLVLGCLGVLTVIGTIAAPIGAQTRFLVRDTLPDFSRYLTVDDCLAASNRLAWRARLSPPFWLDTMEFAQKELLDSMPESVVASVRACSEKFHADSVDVSRYNDWVRLFLVANRDADAEIVARRRLAQASRTAEDTSNTQVTVLLRLLDTYGVTRPVRWKRIQELVTQIATLPDTPPRLKLLKAYSWQLTKARDVDDTPVAEQAARRIIEISEGLTVAETSTPEYIEKLRKVVMEALDYSNRDAILDSLRKSSAAYIAIKRKHWEVARKNSKVPPNFLGERAPALTGDFWFSPPQQPTIRNISDVIRVDGTPVAPSAPMTRPSSGKVSLVVFLYGGCRDEISFVLGKFGRPTYSAVCWDTYSAIRRLVRAYPSLEVTIVSQTTGYVAESRPLTPREEAQVLRSWWLDFHRLPATLVVSDLEHYRLPEPDRRRIDSPTPNVEGYLFGNGQLIENRFAYLIDSDGLIVHAESLGRKEEKNFKEILDVIMNRGR